MVLTAKGVPSKRRGTEVYHLIGGRAVPWLAYSENDAFEVPSMCLVAPPSPGSRWLAKGKQRGSPRTNIKTPQNERDDPVSTLNVKSTSERDERDLMTLDERSRVQHQQQSRLT